MSSKQQGDPSRFRAGYSTFKFRGGSQPRWDLVLPCFQPGELLALPFSSGWLESSFFFFFFNVKFKGSTGLLCSLRGGVVVTVVLWRWCLALGDVQLCE